MENGSKEKRERGGCLTAFIIVFIVLYSLGIIFTLCGAAMSNSSFVQSNEALKASFASVPTWSDATTAILYIVNIVGLILILKWKKIGAYLFIGSAVVSFIISLVISTSIVSSIIYGLIGYVILFGIFYFVVHPVWSHLE